MTAPTTRPGRNQPCHCGSGRKYKQCCLDKDEKTERAALAKAAAKAADRPSDQEHRPAPRRPAVPRTEQPWKGRNTPGFVQRTRTPRKVGGS